MSTIIRLTPPGQLPEPKVATKLIVLCAFDKDEDGVLHAAFEPREMPDERRAIATARMLSLSTEASSGGAARPMWRRGNMGPRRCSTWPAMCPPLTDRLHGIYR